MPVPASLPACLRPCCTDGPCLKEVLERITANVDACVTGELCLPHEEMKVAETCPSCNEATLVAVEEDLKSMRKRATASDAEPLALRCTSCSERCTVSGRIEEAFRSGYQRLYNKAVPSEQERLQMVWTGFEAKSGDALATARRQLDVAFIQDAVNSHDWRHRLSCFKGGKQFCRYKVPHSPTEQSTVQAVFATQLSNGARVKTTELVGLDIAVRKRAIFMFLTDCNIDMLDLYDCNNCVRYVVDQKVSLYYGCYQTKHNSQNAKAVARLLTTLQRFEARLQQQAKEAIANNEPQRGPRSIGTGRMLSGARGATAGETVGAPFISFVARRNKVFDMSNTTVVLPFQQALAFLNGEPIYVSTTKDGKVIATIHDYYYRSSEPCDSAPAAAPASAPSGIGIPSQEAPMPLSSTTLPAEQAHSDDVSDVNMWFFLANYEVFKFPKEKEEKTKSKAGTSVNSGSDANSRPQGPGSSPKGGPVALSLTPPTPPKTLDPNDEHAALAQAYLDSYEKFSLPDDSVLDLTVPDAFAANANASQQPAQDLSASLLAPAALSPSLPLTPPKSSLPAQSKKQSQRAEHKFDSGHPRFETHGYRLRTRPRWVRYYGRRLPDLLDLGDNSTLDIKERDERRVRYAQGILIMFVPFRKLEDLKHSDESWWDAYLRHLPAIKQDKASYDIICNMQNFYESFCRGDSTVEPVFDEDPHQVIKGFLAEENIIDVVDENEPYDGSAAQGSNFVASLQRCSHKTLDLTPPQGSSFRDVSLEDARAAKARLPAKNDDFDLGPEYTSSVSMNSWAKDDEGDTSITLLRQMKESLTNSSFQKATAQTEVPETLPVDTPTITSQSVHWSLNKKQHATFVLLCAALFEFALRCHSSAAQLRAKLGQALILMLSKLLPRDGRLVLYMSGSGGTVQFSLLLSILSPASVLDLLCSTAHAHPGHCPRVRASPEWCSAFKTSLAGGTCPPQFWSQPPLALPRC